MARNVEIKARLTDPNTMRSCVKSLGATGPEELVQTDSFLSVDDLRHTLEVPCKIRPRFGLERPHNKVRIEDCAQDSLLIVGSPRSRVAFVELQVGAATDRWAICAAMQMGR